MLRIGDFVTYDGRAYRLVGVTPMSVRPFAVQLEDSTGELFWVEGDPKQVAAGDGELTVSILMSVDRA